MSNDTFTGWAGVAKGKPLTKTELKLKNFDDDSVEMDITHCGICGSDIHTLDENWGPTDYPCVVGHEIAGVVTRVGKNVTNVKVGDRAGVGAQSGSCHKCEACDTGYENLCLDHPTLTYNSKWPNQDKSYGGYADKWRGDYRFTFKIPDRLSSADACVFFCGGVTVFAPLRRANLSEKSVVGIMGLGGLGHFGVLFAKAMGATVVGISSGSRKMKVASELGCDDYINTSDEDSMNKHKNKLTHILLTGTSPDFQWQKYFDLLKINGHFLNVSAPAWKFPEMSAFTMLMKQVKIEGSAIGSPAEIEDMLKFAEEKNVKPWIDIYPMAEVNKALDDFREGKPRFRFVLEN